LLEIDIRSASIVAITSVSNDCRHASLSMHLLSLDVQLDLGNVRPEEQGNRPVEDEAQTAIPARHRSSSLPEQDPNKSGVRTKKFSRRDIWE